MFQSNIYFLSGVFQNSQNWNHVITELHDVKQLRLGWHCYLFIYCSLERQLSFGHSAPILPAYNAICKTSLEFWNDTCQAYCCTSTRRTESGALASVMFQSLLILQNPFKHWTIMFPSSILNWQRNWKTSISTKERRHNIS